MKAPILALLLVLGSLTSYAQSYQLLGGDCESCELLFQGMPTKLTNTFQVAATQEPGERLHITGRVLQEDGKTPAANVILYIYHTDHQGHYSPTSGQKNAVRHGHLRGWAKTDPSGIYTFHTIKPAPYPNANNPAHIHPIVFEPDGSLYWIDEYLFEGDPYLTNKVRSDQSGRGGSGIISLTKNKSGEWEGKRDIILRKMVK